MKSSTVDVKTASQVRADLEAILDTVTEAGTDGDLHAAPREAAA